MAGLTTLLNSIEKRDVDLYAVELGDLEIVFRLPNVKQAQQYQLLIAMSDFHSERMMIYEHVFRTCVEDKAIAIHDSEMHAGIPESLAKTILFLSGMDQNSMPFTEGMFKRLRSSNDSNINYMKRTVCQVFSGYTFELLDALTYEQLVSNFIQAEKVMLERGIMETPFSLIGKEETQKPKQYSVEDLIRQDSNAQNEFETDGADPESQEKRRMQMEMREKAKSRAKEQEVAHQRRHGRF